MARIWRALLWGLLLVGCRTQLLEVATDGSTQVDRSAWPMQGHDPQHTGRSERVGSSVASVQWSLPLHNKGRTSSPTIAADGTLYIGANDELHAVDRTGHEKWMFAAHGLASAAALGDDKTVYLGRIDGSAADPQGLYALDADGKLRWELHGVDQGGVFTALGAPIFSGGLVYAGFFDRASELCAIDRGGQRRWCTPKMGNSFSSIEESPAVDSRGNSYLSWIDEASNVALHAIDSNGLEKWTFPIPTHYPSRPAIGADDSIYFSVGSNNLIALSSDGSLKWQLNNDDAFGIGSSPAIGPDGTIFFVSAANLNAVNPAGTLKWKYAIGAIGADPVVDAAGTVFLGASNGTFYAVDASGQLRWKLAVDGPIESAAAIGWDGTIYFGSQISLYAIGP